LYFPQGSPEHLRYEEEQLLHAGGELPSPARPLSESTWLRLWPRDVTKEVWRSCCCTQCAEVEDLLDTWGYATFFRCFTSCSFRKLMTVSHASALGNEKYARGDMARRFSTQCTSDTCPWALPEHDPAAHRTPVPFPARFKNKLCSETLREDLGILCPTLYCSPCGCEACLIERQKHGVVDEAVRTLHNGVPAWKRCR
jgi:hypothetical protein